MKETFISVCIIFILVACSDKKAVVGEIPVIDVVNAVENYQRVYCSDLFSSIEVIPLETRDECMLDVVPLPRIVLKDNTIFMRGFQRLFAFDRSGKFLHQIGERGQGPGEYMYSSNFFVNPDKPIIYVEDLENVLEYNFDGSFIRSFRLIRVDGKMISIISYVEDGVFVGQVNYDGKHSYKYSLLNQDGETIKRFPNHVFFNRPRESASTHDTALFPIRVDDRLYLKDYVNDTIYTLDNMELKPAFVFGLGKYTYPKERLETFVTGRYTNLMLSGYDMIGTPDYFFYRIVVPEVFSLPKSKPEYNHLINQYRSTDAVVYGLYNIEQNSNILLDTDDYFQKGIINDINGGLSFFPRYYAGNGEVVGFWNPEDMKEMLTDEYFASQTIKDPEGHQKLKEILRNLKYDDNPVIVIAKLK